SRADCTSSGDAEHSCSQQRGASENRCRAFCPREGATWKAVLCLSRRPRSDTNRMRTFLRYCSIIDHQHGIAAAYEPVCLYEEFGFHRRCVSDPGRNEVMQLIACAERKPLRHRLNALAVARTDQPRPVERAHLSACFVTQPIQKRLEPTSELVSPIRCPTNHGRPLQKADHP